MAGLARAFSFLTVLPVPRPEHRADTGAAWFPLVGAAVGAAAGGLLLLAEPLFGATVAAVLGVGALVILTGGLHQDGLADCADGLGVRGDRARRLEVMRDPSTGAFGALALIGWALLLVTALGSLEREEAFGALVAAGALGRWSCLLHGIATPSARRDGLGAAFLPTPWALAVATVLAAAVLAIVGIAEGVAAAAAAAVVAGVTSVWARRTLGGRTGDTIGATVALAEVAIVLTLLAFGGSG